MRTRIIAVAALVAGLVGYHLAEPWISRQIAIDQLDKRLAAQQFVLDRFQATNAIISQTLADVLLQIPNAARIRFGIIKPPATQENVLYGDLRFEIVNGVAAPGHTAGQPASGAIIEWADYLPALLSGKCVFKRATQLHAPAAIRRMHELGISAFYACPVTLPGHPNILLGALFVSWDVGAILPPDMHKVEERLRAAARQVGAQPLGG